VIGGVPHWFLQVYPVRAPPIRVNPTLAILFSDGDTNIKGPGRQSESFKILFFLFGIGEKLYVRFPVIPHHGQAIPLDGGQREVS
jgi:hypothetical protein